MKLYRDLRQPPRGYRSGLINCAAIAYLGATIGTPTFQYTHFGKRSLTSRSCDVGQTTHQIQHSKKTSWLSIHHASIWSVSVPPSTRIRLDHLGQAGSALHPAENLPCQHETQTASEAEMTSITPEPWVTAGSSASCMTLAGLCRLDTER